MKRTISMLAVLAVLLAPSIPTAVSAGTTATIDWADADHEIELGDGWSAAPCNDNVPAICVAKDGTDVGVVSVGASPLETYDNAELAERAPQRFLRREARRSLRVFAEDRAVGCAADYFVRPERLKNVRLMGERAVQYGFRGAFAGEPFSERIRVRLTIVGDQVVYFNASAHDPGGCVGTDELVFTTEMLADFGNRFGTLARRTPPPGFLFPA